ncbi:MAG TPA: glycosyltransferase family 2 protein [Acidisphaera sp.]|nr:glycosyltransferase family 2 protein [Acidisphaera sp.]
MPQIPFAASDAAPGNLLSIVIPARNEEDNVGPLYAGLCAATSNTSMNVEIIFVVDDSTDQTRQRVAALRAQDKRVRLISLTRSFGHQAALLAGLEQARGNAVISMDGDLQHPPALIPDMIAAWRSGAAVVETIRDDTVDAGWGKRIASRSFYRFMNMLSDTPITPGAADFRLLDRKPLNDLLHLRDQRLFLRGMIAWLGYPHASLHYVAGARVAGRSSYSVRKMTVLAVDAITAFSTKPLRVAFYVGAVTSVLTLCYVVLIMYRWSQGQEVQGWTSLMLAVLFLGAAQLMTLGVVGEYIGRIYDQTRGRPRYLILEDGDTAPATEQPAAEVHRVARELPRPIGSLQAQ